MPQLGNIGACDGKLNPVGVNSLTQTVNSNLLDVLIPDFRMAPPFPIPQQPSAARCRADRVRGNHATIRHTI